MTIEQKALALVNGVMAEYPLVGYEMAAKMALCRAIEQHEAFRQEVSDAVAGAPLNLLARDRLHRFIIAKPDPLVEALNDMKDGRAGPTTESYAACLRAAVEKRGGKIVWGEG